MIEQVRRMRGGKHVAMVRGATRAKIGCAATGPGAAQWVDAEAQEAGDDRVAKLARVC